MLASSPPNMNKRESVFLEPNPTDAPTTTACANAPPNSSLSKNHTPLEGFHLWSLIGGLMMAIYLIGLDMTILSTVIPTLSDYFHTVSDVGWYESAYLLAVCVLQPLVGQLYTVLATKYTYISFLVIFELGSLICAISKTSNVFIIGRAVTGIGSSGLMNGGLIIISAACPPKIRPMVTAFGMCLIGIGGITGPLIGGALTQHVGWQWCFWIFLPAGAVTIIITLVVRVPEQTDKPPFREALASMPSSLDPVGFALFAPAATMFLLGISWGGAEYAWSSKTIVGLLCGAVATLAAFAFWSTRTNAFLIPPATLCRPLVFTGSIVIALQSGSTTLVTYYLPLWFQSIQGVTPTGGGLRLLPSLLSQIAGLGISGGLVRKLHYVPPWAIAGSLLVTIGSGFLTKLSPTSSAAQWIGYQAVTGFGRGLALQMPVISVQEEIPGDEVAIAMSILTLLMYLGSAVGVSAGQTIFRNCLISSLEKYAPHLDSEVIINTGATDIRRVVSSADFPGLLHAYNEALTRIFYFPTATAALAFFLSFGLGWRKIGIDHD